MKTRAKNRIRPSERVRKEKVVRLRVTDQQKQAMEEAAARNGLDMSAWLRQLALRAAGVLEK